MESRAPLRVACVGFCLWMIGVLPKVPTSTDLRQVSTVYSRVRGDSGIPRLKEPSRSSYALRGRVYSGGSDSVCGGLVNVEEEKTRRAVARTSGSQRMTQAVFTAARAPCSGVRDLRSVGSSRDTGSPSARRILKSLHQIRYLDWRWLR